MRGVDVRNFTQMLTEWEVITMKVLRTIDNQILAFWYTSPDERTWAYLATFVPAVAFIIGLATQLF